MSWFGKLKVTGTEFPSGATKYDVRVSEGGEIATTNTVVETNVFSHLNVAGVAATTYYILVDKSGGGSWPHDAAGDRIDISLLRLEVEKNNANDVGTVKLGVITRIDGTDADIDWLVDVAFTKGSEQYRVGVINYSPTQLKCDSSKYITDDTSSNVAAVNTGGTLVSPAGTTTPAVGDVIAVLEYASGTFDIDIECFYHNNV